MAWAHRIANVSLKPVTYSQAIRSGTSHQSSALYITAPLYSPNRRSSAHPRRAQTRILHPTMGSKSPDKYVRPRLHITVPYWLNDPCAPGFDPNTGLYHLFYQCNPFSTEWGNMSWGHVTSKDLLHWTFVPEQPALAPDMDYDKAGVFTGGMLPLVGSDKKLHVFYSSICRLPFHWHTPPYPRNSAGLAMATSEDGGVTWTKSSKNPILLGEPEGALVSGYRDPYIFTWKKMDELRHSETHFYGLVSGGFDAKGPTSFLYAIHPDRLEEWQYLGPLVDLPLRWNPSIKWGGNFGINWECVNFMSLVVNPTELGEKQSLTKDFLIIGAEGDTERPDIKNHKLPDGLPARTVRTQVWMQGDLEKTRTGEVRLRHKYSGLFDHGSYYAANSFVHPDFSRRIVHGWIPEEDCSAQHAANKGWNGCLALPREVFVLCIDNVVRTLHTPLEDLTNVEVIKSATGNSIQTMGIQPFSELINLRKSALRFKEFGSLTLPYSKSTTHQIVANSTPTWELEASISVSPRGVFGFYLKHSPDRSVYTKLTFDLPREKITLDRSNSIFEKSLLNHINTCPESGPFTLFTTTDARTGVEQLEKLHVRIFSDGDALEVFVNDRFALSTVVYTGHYDQCGGVCAFVSDSHCPGELTVFESIKFWDGLNNGQSLLSGWEHAERKQQARLEDSKL